MKLFWRMVLTGLSLPLSLTAHAQSLDVTFTANILETTCNMQLSGGTGSGSNNTYIIGDANGKVGLDDIINKTDNAKIDFSLKATECPSSLSSINVSLNGSGSSIVNTIINNSLSGSGSDYTGISIARASAPDSPFKVNTSGALTWTAAEISAGEVDLIARIEPTNSAKATTGAFQADVTFNFTYE